MVRYFNLKSINGIETVDSLDSKDFKTFNEFKAELNRLVREYHLCKMYVYISQRAAK